MCQVARQHINVAAALNDTRPQHAVCCDWCLQSLCDWQLFLSGPDKKRGGGSICRWQCQKKKLVNLSSYWQIKVTAAIYSITSNHNPQLAYTNITSASVCLIIYCMWSISGHRALQGQDFSCSPQHPLI